MVETALNPELSRGRVVYWRAAIVAAVLVALLGAMVMSGQWPELRSKVAFSPAGLVATAPADVRHVEIRASGPSVAFERRPGGWSIAGMNGLVPAELSSHLETALRLLHVSAPARVIAPAELTVGSFAEYGLDPPTSVAMVESNSGAIATVNFGSLNPASTAHYARLSGRPTVYLLPRHVGQEWRVTFDMARRLHTPREQNMPDRGKDLLLPVSMAQVWAVEIVFAGKLTRFERDPAGNWFRHVGQHSHAAGALAHVADPAQARMIDAALGAFDAATAEKRIGSAEPSGLARFGFDRPTLIALFYPRDSSTPLARLEFGAPADSLDRYGRLAPDGAVITVAEFEIKRLTELLRAVGAGS